MAIPIRSVPTLKGKEAKEFVKKADEAYKNRASIDFSEEIKKSRIILEKAGML
jgi:ribosomal protein L7/L12